MDLPGIDLNLLVALQALLQERNVTRAGESIGLSQPATSAALGRLRRHFGDELLTRDGQRYVLTPLATSLLDQCEVALRYVEHTFAARPVFDARTSDREFSVAMSDYALTVLGGPLLRLLEQHAPRVRLRIQPLERPTAEDGAVTALRAKDLMVMPHGYITDLPHAELYRDRWVVVCTQDNTLVGDGLTRDDLERLRWIITYDTPTQYTPADKHLHMAGIKRHADVVVDNFLALPFLLAGTERVCVLQQRLADRLRVSSGIRVLELPVAVPDLAQAMWWHPSRAFDPGHRWLQQIFRDAADTLGELGPVPPGAV